MQTHLPEPINRITSTCTLRHFRPATEPLSARAQSVTNHTVSKKKKKKRRQKVRGMRRHGYAAVSARLKTDNKLPGAAAGQPLGGAG